MSYVRIESSVRTNRKFIQAGPAAAWLWLCGVLYCQDALTDGFVPDEILEFLGVKQARKLVPALEQAQLWHAVGGGWRIHDYLEHNRSAAQVEAIKERNRDNAASGGRASGKVRTKRSASPVASPHRSGPLSDSLSASLQHDRTSDTATDTTTDTKTITEQTRDARARGSSIVQPRRKDAAWEGGRLYVPQRLHADFIADRHTPQAERELLAWYAEVDEAWAHGAHEHDETGGEMFVFWRQRYAEKWPAKKVKADKWEAFGHDQS